MRFMMLALLSSALLLMGGEEFESYQDAYSLGREDIEYGDYDDAVKHLNIADGLASKPKEHYLARLTMAEALRQSGKTGEAITMLESISALPGLESTFKTSALIKAGDWQLADKRLDAAVVSYEKAFGMEPKSRTNWAALRKAGVACFQGGRPQQALVLFQRISASEGCPQDLKVTCQIDAIKTLNRQSRHDEAMAMIRRTEAMSCTTGQKVQLAGEKARILTKAGKVDDALSLLEGSLGLPDVSPDWRAYLHWRMAELWFKHKKNAAKAQEYCDLSNGVKGATWGKNVFLTREIKGKLARP